MTEKDFVALVALIPFQWAEDHAATAELKFSAYMERCVDAGHISSKEYTELKGLYGSSKKIQRLCAY